MPALEIRHDEIGQFDLAAYKARKARMGVPTARVVLAPAIVARVIPYVAPVPVAEPPKRERRKIEKPVAINRRPDLARQCYKLSRPLRVGHLRVVQNAKNVMLKRDRYLRVQDRIRARREREKRRRERVCVEKFQPVKRRANYIVKPIHVFHAMKPGLPRNLTGEIVTGTSRIGDAALARMIIYYFLKDGLGISYAAIGRYSNRDHTSALSGANRIRAMVAAGELTDPIPYLLGLAPSLAAE
jgi:hypothetical protein